MRVSSAVIILLLPLLAFAIHPEAVRAAGFAKQSLFLSQSTVTEGQTVAIYAVVENDTSVRFNGTLEFADQSGSIGSAAVTLDAGVAATVSVPWTPEAGQYDVTADLVATDGTTVESEDATFIVNPPPTLASAADESADSTSAQEAEPAATSMVESSQPLQTWVASTAPAVSGYTAPILSTLDAGRAASAAKLDQSVAWSKDAIRAASEAPGSWQNTLWLAFVTATLYVCAALSYLVDNIGIFYPFLALIFFYILWRLYRWARRR